MDVAGSSHLGNHDWLKTCHMETDAFTVHNNFTIMTLRLQPHINGQIIV